MKADSGTFTFITIYLSYIAWYIHTEALLNFKQFLKLLSIIYYVYLQIYGAPPLASIISQIGIFTTAAIIGTCVFMSHKQIQISSAPPFSSMLFTSITIWYNKPGIIKGIICSAIGIVYRSWLNIATIAGQKSKIDERIEQM